MRYVFTKTLVLSRLLLFSFFLSFFLIQATIAQNCSDLMVTEIVFGKVESLSATSFNHSVEVYNPRDTPIDLSTYSIQLVEENGDRIVIQLEGIVPPKDVHVISNFTANIGIQTVSDVLDLLLSFEGKVAIELTKGNGEIIDKIGREGIETTSDVINFAELLNNPNYLDFLDINLGSIENLLIKRKGIVQKGNIDFSNEDLMNEWVIMPNFEISV